MKRFILVCIAFVSVSVFAQVIDAPITDGAWVKEHVAARKPIPYTHLREADVLWGRRIWRVIDLREKINHPMYYPTQPTVGRVNLMTVIFNGLKEGQIKAYTSDDFSVELTYDGIMNSLERRDSTIAFRDYPPYEQYDTVIVQPFDPTTVMMFRLQEDWFVDKQRSVMDVRIRGLCPLRASLDADGNVRGFVPLFWIYFPHVRELFAKNEVYNRHNDAARMSFDDLFFKRMFSSYIIKETNVYDRSISEYALGLDGLLEADRIKEELFIIEHDLWEY
jgi:gliding motility associated protien GldN